jgi:outer membrane protein OmpA-like peptidoglycan-associated protein
MRRSGEGVLALPERWTDRILAGAVDVETGPTVPAGAGEAPSVLVEAVGNGDTPLTLGPDSLLWQGTPDDKRIQRLAKELIATQVEAQRRITATIRDLLVTDDLRAATETAQRPARVLGRLVLPGGAAVAGLRVSLDAPGLTAAEAARSAATTAADGSFAIQLPPRLRDVSLPAPGLLVQGADGSAALPGALADLPGAGVLPVLALDRPLSPLPVEFLGMLSDVDSTDGTVGAPAEMPSLPLGEDGCSRLFEKDASSDRFPFSVMFRLTDPAVVAPTLAFRIPGDLLSGVLEGRRAELPVYGPISPALVLPGALDKVELELVERVPISRPLSVDGFRDGLARPPTGVFAGTPLAGSLALGYVVRMAQRWSPLGLALGDLVYSLPLAPGEQQRVAVVERTASATVIDAETLETTEAQSFSEQDDTSTDATFQSALDEVAGGHTSMQSQAGSSSTAGAGGVGFAVGPVLVGGGVSASEGSSFSQGSTQTSMFGTTQTTSATAEATHAAVQRQASARRQAARTGMRLATASETDRVVTKVITNHNKTRALTVQYWEVLRLFDVTTSVEGVTLICLVPLDVVRFLPDGEPAALLSTPADRAAVLRRYAQLIGHADVLARVVPNRYRQGLTLITEFAGDPQAAVQGAGGDAEDVLTLSLTGRFLPFEDLYVTVVSKRGLRTPATLLTGPMDPLPGGTDAYASETELLQDVRDRRSPSGTTTTLLGSVVLPRSIPRQEVAGFEISRRFRPLDYAFLGEAVRSLANTVAVVGTGGDLSSAIAAAAGQPPTHRSYSPDQLESLFGGPPVTAFSATASTVQFAQTTFGGSPLLLPRTAYPVSSQVVPPLLGYTSVLEIEKTLQWCIRNTMTCSVAVFSSLTPEERVVLLERYELPLPADADGTPQSVPLVSCITNTVLGYFGNCMILPFQIPFAATVATTRTRPDGTVLPGLTTADITDALTRFHTDGFTPPRSTTALPTKGVLGEAVLGHCASAEKIDLTRFWNWQDSPGDDATEIGPVSLPQGALTTGLEAPNDLVSLSPVINNFSTTGPSSPAQPAGTATAPASGTAAAQQAGFDVAALTNQGNLATVVGKTADNAEAARKDALSQASSLAGKAMDAAVKLVTEPAKPAEPAASTSSAPTVPADLSVYFAVDKTVIEDAPAGTTETGQIDAIINWAAAAKAAKATAIRVRGYASSDDTAAQAEQLQSGRADALRSRLEAEGLTNISLAPGGVLSGPAGNAGKLQRADASVIATG